MGAAASGLSETVPQSYIHQSSHKWQTERLPRRHQRTGTGTLPQAHRGHEAITGQTEQLKAENALEWTGKVNNLSVYAREIVEQEIIYT